MNDTFPTEEQGAGVCSAATAAILHCYSDGQGSHRDVFRSKYLAVFDFIFGNTGEGSHTQACLDAGTDALANQ